DNRGLHIRADGERGIALGMDGLNRDDVLPFVLAVIGCRRYGTGLFRLVVPVGRHQKHGQRADEYNSKETKPHKGLLLRDSHFPSPPLNASYFRLAFTRTGRPAQARVESRPDLTLGTVSICKGAVNGKSRLRLDG